MALISEPGFYLDLTPAQYFAEPCPAPALTNTGIKLLAPIGAAPAKFAYQHPAIGQPPEAQKDTLARHLGRLVHRLALDKGDEYEVSPYDRYQSNEAKAWKADVERRGRMPVKPDVLKEAEQMALIVRDRIITTCNGYPYETEVVIAWQEDVEIAGGKVVTVWCRAMIDVWCEDLMLALDVKTCADANDDPVLRQFSNGYATQDCWYLRGLGKVTGRPGHIRFGFLFVESEPPYLARPCASTESFRHGAKQDVERALTTFATCLNANEWPGYAPFKAYPPSWLLQKWTAGEMMELAAE
jgi:hypothetical protein